MREFAVVPPARIAWVTLLLLLAAPMVAMVVAMRGGGAWESPSAWTGPVLLVVVACLMPALLRRRSVRLEDGTLVVRAGFNTRRVAVRDLDVDKARVVDLAERTELQPVLKGFGTGLPGFRAGWFITHGDHRRVFCLLTGRERVLVLEPRDGRPFLLSLEDPQALLSQLREPAGNHPSGRVR